ncbi:uncharacterized protein LOC142230722 [Haematobia irritans]|uniref:uncharacterized protein LOC142230722 n=1 Tax=Haematobia irritans TaxID=7368 RepID=UPI003F4F51EF
MKYKKVGSRRNSSEMAVHINSSLNTGAVLILLMMSSHIPLIRADITTAISKMATILESVGRTMHCVGDRFQDNSEVQQGYTILEDILMEIRQTVNQHLPPNEEIASLIDIWGTKVLNELRSMKRQCSKVPIPPNSMGTPEWGREYVEMGVIVEKVGSILNCLVTKSEYAVLKKVPDAIAKTVSALATDVPPGSTAVSVVVFYVNILADDLAKLNKECRM